MKQFFDLLTGITTDQAVALKNGLAVTGNLSVSGTSSLGTSATVAGGFTAGSTVTLTNGNLAFPAVQVTSAGVNVLDDYEEGTWTPALSTPGSATYTNQVGWYTKQGRDVTVGGRLTINAIGTGTATSSIAGLPFTVGDFSGGSIGYFGTLAISPVFLTIHVQSGDVVLRINALTAAAASMTLTPAVWGNSADMIFGARYRV